MKEAHLVTFLSCWLCIFVLPMKEGDVICQGVATVACYLACGRRVSLVVPVLANIYRALNTISKCSWLYLTLVYLPVHYVCG